MDYNIPTGVVCREEYIVKREHGARVLGKDLDVLSTPSMILFMEATAWKCVQKYLLDKHTTVGTKVCIEHKAPAPIGAKITVESELMEVHGRKLVFKVRALWKDIVIGEGVHERYIVDKDKFINKIKKLLGSK